MEIKYTLEILTKDIQDIEKLVANLQNSPDGSTLELDLALSKLRNVYDILTVIRADMSPAGKISEAAPEQAVAAKAPPVTAEVPPVAAEVPPVAAEVPPIVEKESGVPDENKGIIAEKFAAESSINENLAGIREQEMESKLMGEPIESISRNIGINDRFLIIRELFDGDSDGFGKLIEELDSAVDLEAASHLLESKFQQVPDHEGVTILSNLVKRRFNRN